VGDGSEGIIDTYDSLFSFVGDILARFKLEGLKAGKTLSSAHAISMKICMKMEARQRYENRWMTIADEKSHAGIETPYTYITALVRPGPRIFDLPHSKSFGAGERSVSQSNPFAHKKERTAKRKRAASTTCSLPVLEQE